MPRMPARLRPPKAAASAGPSSSTAKLDYAAHLRASGQTIAEIVAKTGIPRTSLYRHLPPRAAPTVTADSRAAETKATAMRVGAADAG
jgi:DNA-binding phage protein